MKRGHEFLHWHNAIHFANKRARATTRRHQVRPAVDFMYGAGHTMWVVSEVDSA